ncbi:hypothetical protein SAMN05444411_107103 [Lutibacter oricola]|uniref:Uncharacterized protein n=1 Tax=Lutibacter oricola TaxID=762486 RepID=A0A1H3DBL4_9FLAO|nr:hypothetical protein [Lutibacter oricola]SDX63710.1 hypothetical protein SAMN05444411_107103 [Lutibacter oricola]
MSKYLKNSINCTLFRNTFFRKNIRENEFHKLTFLALSIALSGTLLSCNSKLQEQQQPIEKLTFSEDIVKELKEELDITKKQLSYKKQLPELKESIILNTEETKLIPSEEYIEYRIENNGFINLNYFSPIAFNVE